MKDKYQQLVEEDAFVATSSEVNVATISPAVGRVNKGSRKRLCIGLALLTICTLAILCTCVLTAFIFIHQWNEKFYGYKTHVKSSSRGTQYVTASEEQNFVQYYIENDLNEKTWIFDDFNLNLEIIKTVTDDDTVCYVAELNYTEAVPPSKAALNEMPVEKKQFHSVMSPDMNPVSDIEFLGLHGTSLCKGVEVYWLRPMSDVLDITEYHQDLNITSPMRSDGRSSRSKRNIKECQTSCCWLVCCCDVHHYKWEAYEHFTCRHVCKKCTAAYKRKIQKFC